MCIWYTKHFYSTICLCVMRNIGMPTLLHLQLIVYTFKMVDSWYLGDVIVDHYYWNVGVLVVKPMYSSQDLQPWLESWTLLSTPDGSCCHRVRDLYISQSKCPRFGIRSVCVWGCGQLLCRWWRQQWIRSVLGHEKQFVRDWCTALRVTTVCICSEQTSRGASYMAVWKAAVYMAVWMVGVYMAIRKAGVYMAVWMAGVYIRRRCCKV